MLNQIVALSKDLISQKSDPDNTEALDACLHLALKQVSGYPTEQFERDGAKSALVYNTPHKPKTFKVILNGHLDVIPAKEFQYTPKVVGNKLYGAGAMDMKSNVACLITAFKEVAKKVKYPLGLQLVTDEEIGGFNGTKYQIEKGVRTDFVIAGETTNLNIVHKAKGIAWVKISASGVTAHGAYPWDGDNAIWKMNTFLNRLKKLYPNPKEKAWKTTVNLAKISTTNETFNKIPDNCEALLDIRYIQEDSNKVITNVKKLLPSGCTMQVINKEPALFVKENNKFIQKLKQVDEFITKKKVTLYGAQGSSDARHFTDVGCNGIEFGAVGGGSGSDEEWIDIPSLKTYTEILKTFLLSL